jgi:stearoyl-CoA desaturase (delta-9 desaturase)
LVDSRYAGSSTDWQRGEHLASVSAGTLLRCLLLALVVGPFLGVLAAVVLLWRSGVGLLEIGLLASTYAITTGAVTVGFHRLFAHRAFCTHRLLRAVLAIAGSTAAQGPVIYWAATHRRHHSHSDQPGDPHSPHVYDGRSGSQLRDLFHAHVGWLFGHDFTDCARYAPDLLRDPVLVRINRLYLVWVFLGLALPAAAGALLAGTWEGALTGCLWGGFVRIFVLQHTTFSINSICHVFGSRSFPTPDRSTNNSWLALISFGEAWHNNHHAFPTSAKFGLRWWQIDLGAAVIRALELARLAWNVRTPTVRLSLDVVARVANRGHQPTTTTS